MSGLSRHRWRHGRCIGKELMGPVCLRERILGGEEPFGRGSVTLPLGVLLESVGDGDGPVAQVLSVHGLDGRVGCVEAGEIDEGESLRVARRGIPHNLKQKTKAAGRALDWLSHVKFYLGSLKDHTEGGEGVVEELLVHLWV